jgi:hypothetical protein
MIEWRSICTTDSEYGTETDFHVQSVTLLADNRTNQRYFISL